MVAVMESESTTATGKAVMLLNRDKLDELRRANGIGTEAELASIIGVDAATLWRATQGNPVSGGFIARVKIAFPHVALDLLFDSERRAA